MTKNNKLQNISQKPKDREMGVGEFWSSGRDISQWYLCDTSHVWYSTLADQLTKYIHTHKVIYI